MVVAQLKSLQIQRFEGLIEGVGFDLLTTNVIIGQEEGMNRGSIGVGECNQQLHKSISFNIISLHTDGR